MKRSALIPRLVLFSGLLGVTLGAAAAPAPATKSPAAAATQSASKSATQGPANGAAKAPAKAPAAQKPGTAPAYNSLDDLSKFLPDSFVIARVKDREITVRTFINEYFYSYAEFRPKPDSLGRVDFLKTLVNKNVLGLTALEVDRPLTFDERAQLREYARRIISNTLFRRYVLDSLNIDEAAVLADYEHYKENIRIRHIQFDSPAVAERVRLEMLAGKITWKEAARLYNRSVKDQGPDGELGWASRMGLETEMALRVYDLRPGETSKVFQDLDGFQIVQVVERRTVRPPSLQSVRSNIEASLRQAEASRRADQLQSLLASQVGITYDSTNVKFACSHFIDATKSSRDAKGAQVIEVNDQIPDFAPADTSRVLARWKDGGRFTLAQFVSAYQGIQPMLRPPVNDPLSFITQVRGFVLEPYVQTYAIERGMDKDPLTVSQMDAKTEQVRVERMVQDSIEAKISVSNADRRAYFKAHEKEFTTFESRRFFVYGVASSHSGDSLAAKLKAGTRPEDILLADSLRGVVRGSIQDRREDEHGPLQRVLFSDLHAGQIIVDGPGPDSTYSVVKLMSVTPRRQMTFEQSQGIVDESVQNLKSEAALNALIARHAKGYHIVSHPELVMKIRLVDPGL